MQRVQGDLGFVRILAGSSGFRVNRDLAEAHLHIMVKSWQNQACDMTIGKARLDIVGAEPIGSELAFAVWKL